MENGSATTPISGSSDENYSIVSISIWWSCFEVGAVRFDFERCSRLICIFGIRSGAAQRHLELTGHAVDPLKNARTIGLISAAVLT
jgi:hypothetical protein